MIAPRFSFGPLGPGPSAEQPYPMILPVHRVRLQGFLKEALPSPEPSPTPSGSEIIKCGLSASERVRFDLARGPKGPSDWARDTVLAQVRSGRAPAAVPGAGGGATFLNFRLAPADVAALDVGRGAASRSAYVRAAILAALG